MKIWLDDLRPAPAGFVWCRSVNEAKRLIAEQETSQPIECIDCDHDLGDYADDGGDGIRLLDWLLERGTLYPVALHTMNPVGRDYFLEHVCDCAPGKEPVFKGDCPVVVDFWATWCGPCMKLMPEMEKLAAKYKGRVTFLKVNADKEKELCNLFGVDLLPTLLFFSPEGEMIRDVGADIEKYENIIKEKLLKE